MIYIANNNNKSTQASISEPSSALNTNGGSISQQQQQRQQPSLLYPSLYQDHFSRLLISRSQLQSRVKELAQTIHESYPRDEPIVLLCILKGSSPFFHFLAAELSRLNHPYILDFYRAKSYQGTESSGSVQTNLSELPKCVQGRNVLVVEDIIDTGRTLGQIMPQIQALQPKRVEVCVMVVKRLDALGGQTTNDVQYRDALVGFSVPDEFLVGVGLDYNEMYRDLLDIWVLGDVGIQAGGYEGL